MSCDPECGDVSDRTNYLPFVELVCCFSCLHETLNHAEERSLCKIQAKIDSSCIGMTSGSNKVEL